MSLLDKLNRKGDALGLCVEGLSIHTAWIQRRGNRLELKGITRSSFASSIRPPEMESRSNPIQDDPFGMLQVPTQGVEAAGIGADNLKILLRSLRDYPMARMRISFNLLPEDTRLVSLENPEGLSGRKLRRWLRFQIGGENKEGGTEVRLLPSEGERLLAVSHSGGLPVLEALEDLSGYFGKRPPRILAADVLESALATAVELGMGRAEGAVTGVVHLGDESCRLLVIRDGLVLRRLPLLPGGGGDPETVVRAASRLLHEQDEERIPALQRIILTGQLEKDGSRELGVFRSTFEGVEIQIYEPTLLELDGLDRKGEASLAPYAGAIGLALRTALPSRSGFAVDFLPPEVHQRQKVYSLAWHGYVLLAVLGVGTSILVYMSLDRGRDIKVLRQALKERQEIASQWQETLNSISKVEAQIKNYQTYLTTISDLEMGMVNWTGLLNDLTELVSANDGVWVEAVRCLERGFTVEGLALSREQVGQLAGHFQGAELDHVSRSEYRGRGAYEFELTVPFPDGVQLRGVQKTRARKNRRQ